MLLVLLFHFGFTRKVFKERDIFGGKVGRNGARWEENPKIGHVREIEII